MEYGIKQLEKEVELLREIISLKERVLELEKYNPQYPLPYIPNPYSYPIYPVEPAYPYPIITWQDTTGQKFTQETIT